MNPISTESTSEKKEELITQNDKEKAVYRMSWFHFDWDKIFGFIISIKNSRKVNRTRRIVQSGLNNRSLLRNTIEY